MRKLLSLTGLVVLAAVLGFAGGALWSQDRHAQAAAASVAEPGKASRKIKYYWDPMLGPSSIADKPGKSAMNMDLVPVFEDQESDSGKAGTGGLEVKIDSTVVQNMGVTTAAVVRGPLTVTVRAVGMLQVPEPGMHDITLKVSGYIEKLYANTEGMSVSKGQVLFDLYSPDIQMAEQELIAAQQNLKALDAKTGDALRQDAKSLVDSAKQKLRLWDVADQDIAIIADASQAPKTVPFRSPASGHLMDKIVVEGSAVQAGMKVMRIEDHTQLWLDAQVYEDQFAMVKIGQEVRATVDGVPGKTFTGKVSFISPHLNHLARTELVRTVLNNPAHELRPGMFASADIVTEVVPDAILVPREAVIDTGTRQIAFVMDPTSAGHFQPRLVRTGMAGDEDQVRILDGLAPGDQVVTSGQFLMDVESRTTEAIEKLQKGSAAGMGLKEASLKPAPRQMIRCSQQRPPMKPRRRPRHRWFLPTARCGTRIGYNREVRSPTPTLARPCPPAAR